MKKYNYWDELIENCKIEKRVRILDLVYNWLVVFAIGWFMAILLVSLFIE